MDKRYQVFVSSTYTDLKEERQRVTQTLMEMDCIPAGMELFPATDEEQWVFIKSIIDDCDYYLLIIGGRYGSISSEGISFTEKEYDYAVQIGLKVVALIHGSPERLALEKSEHSAETREKLQAFRNKASTGRLVKYWKEGSELPGLVALSLSKTMKLFPAVGWVRGNEGSSEQLLKEINELRKENEGLRAQLENLGAMKLAAYSVSDLAGLDDVIELNGTYLNGARHSEWRAAATWREIFYFVSPYLVKISHQDTVKEVLRVAICARDNINTMLNKLNDQVFQTVSIQLKVLGLVRIDVLKGTDGRNHVYWRLTTEGEKFMVELRTIKKLPIADLDQNSEVKAVGFEDV
jgi:hypothetical protein